MQSRFLKFLTPEWVLDGDVSVGFDFQCPSCRPSGSGLPRHRIQILAKEFRIDGQDFERLTVNKAIVGQSSQAPRCRFLATLNNGVIAY